MICVTVSSICENHHYGSANMVEEKIKKKEKERNEKCDCLLSCGIPM
jgi:hypothetical protein